SPGAVRVRRRLRLRHRGRQRPQAALPRRPCTRRSPHKRTRPVPGTGRVQWGHVPVRILNASGCLDALAAPEVARQLDAFVTKTVTPLPREGNAPPRIAETTHGMLNAIGLANPGRDRFLAEHLPRLSQLGVPIWVSVGGFTAADYAETCAVLRSDEVAAVELNLSCPNVDEAADSAAEIVSACRRASG